VYIAAIGDYMGDRGMQPESTAPKTPNGGAAATRGGQPAGATMKVPGSDGKLHWSDGKKDLGVVE
jgi:hypothetical protein